MFIAVVGKRGEGSRRRRLLEGADDGMKSSPLHRAGEAVAAGRERCLQTSGAEIIARGWGELRLGDVEALVLELLQQEHWK